MLILLLCDWDLIMWGVLLGGSRFIFMKATHCVTLECLLSHAISHFERHTGNGVLPIFCFPFFFLFRRYPAQENLSVIDGGSLQTAWQNFPFRLRKLLFFFRMLHLELNAWTVHNNAESGNKLLWLISFYSRSQLPVSFDPNEMSCWENGFFYNCLFL